MKFDKINSRFISEFTLVNHCYDTTRKELSSNQVLKKRVKLHNSLSVNIPYISTFSGVSQFTLRSVFFIVDTTVDTIPVDNFLRQFAISNFTNR